MGRLLLLSLLLVLGAPAMAASLLLPRYANDDLDVMASPSYLATHPDYRWRVRGLASLARGEVATAIEELRNAARYADKAAQAVLGELYWSGRGGHVDRGEGHAFMALAAERGYPRYVALRDRYGSELGEAERAASTQRHAQLLADYGDAVAKPRLEEALRSLHARRDGSRSRAGFAARPFHGGMPGSGLSGGSGVEQRDWHDRKYWQPAAYWAWQDTLYGNIRPPRVKVIELKPFERSHPPKRGVLSEED